MAERKPLEAAVTAMSDLPLRRFGRPVGRDDTLRALLLRLRQSQPLVLHGASGIGKTTIAATIANVILQRGEQAVLWLGARQPTLVELLARIGRAYGDRDICNAANPLSQAAAVADLLRQRNPLLILDGAIDESVLTQLYQRCCQGISLVATNDRALGGGDWRNQGIGNLSTADAVLLFKQKAGIPDDETVDAINAIVGRFNNEPFPLVVAARSMIVAQQSPAEFDAALGELLDEADGNGSAAALNAGFRALNPRLQDLLVLLGATARGEASGAFLSYLADMPIAAVNKSMTVLSRLFLVDGFQRANHDVYRLHPIVQDYLQAHARENEQLDELREKIGSATLARLNDLIDEPDAESRLIIEMDHIVATAAAAAEAGDANIALDIGAVLSSNDELVREAGYAYELTLLQALGEGRVLEFDEVEETTEEATSDDGEEAIPVASSEDPEAGDVEVADGLDVEDEETETAPPVDAVIDDAPFMPVDDDELQSVSIDQLRTALNVARENNETARQLLILKAIAKLQIKQEREAEAIATYGDVLEIYESNADKEGVLETLDLLAGLLISSESPPDAIEGVELRTALSLARQHDDRPRALEILEAIGKIQIDRDREDEAVATFNEVLQIHEDNDDKAGILSSLDMLAGLLVRTGAAVTALNHIQRGLHLAADLSDQEAEMFLQINRGDAHLELGESVTAIEAFELALTIARNRDDQQNEAQILFKLGLAQLDIGDPRQAIAMLESANDHFKRQSNRAMEGQVLRGLGAVHVQMERWSEAVNFHTSALYIAREIHDRAAEAQQLRQLGKVLTEANRLPEALTRYRQALHVAYEEDHSRDIVAVICDLVGLMMRNTLLSSIAELLVNDGLTYDADDRELLRLKGEVDSAKKKAADRGMTLAVVAGTAKDYAANAYNYN